jgi:DNA-binding SARP family transcriptional activator
MARLTISCLGPFQATLDGKPITDFKSTKVRALLAYLAVESNRPHPCEVLAALLWPDWLDRDALSNLRYALSDLRRAIGDRTAQPPFMLVTRETLQLDTQSDCSVDFLVCTAAMEQGARSGNPSDLENAISLWRGRIP